MLASLAINTQKFTRESLMRLWVGGIINNSFKLAHIDFVLPNIIYITHF